MGALHRVGDAAQSRLSRQGLLWQNPRGHTPARDATPAAARRDPRSEQRKQDRPREEWIEIPVPALIDESTFARAHELLHENKLRARRRTIHPSLVQGLVSCRRCGYALSRIAKRTSTRRIHYFRCIGSDAWRHLGGSRCNTRPVRQDRLEEIVW